MEQIAAAGYTSHSRQVRQDGIHSGEMQCPSLDARDFCGPEEFPLLDFRRRRRLYAARFAAGKVYSDRLPRVLRRADPGSVHHWQRNEKRKLRLQSQALLSLFRIHGASPPTRMQIAGETKKSRSEERRVGKECRHRWGQE